MCRSSREAGYEKPIEKAVAVQKATGDEDMEENLTSRSVDKCAETELGVKDNDSVKENEDNGRS